MTDRKDLEKAWRLWLEASPQGKSLIISNILYELEAFSDTYDTSKFIIGPGIFAD